MTIEKLIRHKSQRTDQIPAKLIKAAGRTIRSEIHKCINSIWKKEELPGEWKQSLILPIYKKRINTDCSNYRGISPVAITCNIVSNSVLTFNSIWRGHF